MRKIIISLFVLSLMLLTCGCSSIVKQKEGINRSFEKALQQTTSKVSDAAEDNDQSISNEDKAVMTKEDFNVYNLEGELIDYPLKQDIMYSYRDEGADKIQTKRGVKIGDSAKVALEKYDLTYFYMGMSTWLVEQNITNEMEDKLVEDEKRFQKKYPDINEQIKHNEEIIGWFVKGIYYEKDGELYPVKLDKNGYYNEDYPYLMYELDFQILEGKIKGIWFRNYPDKAYTLKELEKEKLK